MRRLLLLALVAAPRLAAQDAEIPWRTSYYPYVFGNASTGVMLIAHAQYGRQAAYEARVPFDALLSAEAGASLHGSWLGTLRFRAPLLVRGWRFSADAGAVREAGFGYYGRGAEGENTVFTEDPAYSGDFFRVARRRIFFRAEATRRLAGPLQLSAAAGFEQFRFSPVEDGGMFATDYLDAPLSGTDATGRLTLVLDTRNHELLVANGVLLEAGVYGGTGRSEERFIPPFAAAVSYSVAYSDRGYTGAYAHFRGYVSPRSGTVVAARVAARGLSAEAPLEARYNFPGWERDLSVLGGPESHRSFRAGRLLGRGLLFSSLEVRHTLLDVGDYGAITLLAFLDGGRAFGERNPQLTLKRWQVGGGGGVALRVLRSALLTFNFAGGPDGFRFSMGNGWSF